MAINLFLCTLEAYVRDLFEMTTVSSVHFLTRSAKLSMHEDRVKISIGVYSRKARTITDLKEIREEIIAVPRPVCKNVMDNFVSRLTELNSGHLEHMLLHWTISIALALNMLQEQADRYHALVLCLEYNKLVTSAFSFNLNGNLRNRVG